MALTNRDRVGQSIDLLTAGLRPFVVQQVQAVHKDKWTQLFPAPIAKARKPSDLPNLDSQALLHCMVGEWRNVFTKTLGHAERSLVGELIEVRNLWAHQKAFSTADAYRAVDSMHRLLTAISAPQASEVEKVMQELMRIRYEETARKEVRKATGKTVETGASSSLKPWREVITPHHDVAKGSYQQAEFMADLWQVYCGEASSEYQKPEEFFRRTFSTDGLSRLLTRAIQRLGGQGGDPVVELQTNFGGGKTHSLIALYHLFSGQPVATLPGMEDLIKSAGLSIAPGVSRAVLVGQKISPGQEHVKPDGTKVRTLWGELAWQLAKKDGYELVAEADQTGTNPGDALRNLFNLCSPCLVLMDEWTSYARQLQDSNALPAGSFETHLTFAQAITEAARAADRALLVVSIPASDNEIGGERGREFVDRLKNVVGRVESTWRPAGVEESFEIVRRRLFEPIRDEADYRSRDAVVKAFADMYRKERGEFPQDCGEGAYEERMRKSYPIHPELLDRLYDDWSTLDKFQRTRGVLRLMAAVISRLWERQDASPMILPAHVPIDDSVVQDELTRHLEDTWTPVIETDVDGPRSLPLKTDRENSNFGRYSACRRVARTLFLGSAPTLKTARRGIDDKRIRLGCAQPGESVHTFGDALRRLGDQATHMYSDGGRYWFSTQPSVLRIAQERAEQQNIEDVLEVIRKQLGDEKRTRGQFDRVHTCPSSPADVPDERSAALVILGPEHPHISGAEQSAAIAAADEILKTRSGGPRNYPNTLSFMAADQTRLKDLEQAVRQWLAWKSIVKEIKTLNLDPFQQNQATERQDAAHETIGRRMPETYSWVLVKQQNDPQRQELKWEVMRANSTGSLSERASKKLINQGYLMDKMGGLTLRHHLDQVPLWDGDHVRLEQLADYFAKYLYLPRLKNTQVLVEAVMDGIDRLTWQSDGFAYAEAWDAEAGRYRGLRAGRAARVVVEKESVVVKSEAADRQLKEEAPPPPPPGGDRGEKPGDHGPGVIDPPPPPPPPKARRFHASIRLDPQRVASGASTIANEVIQHLEGIPKANVQVSIEIQAEMPDGTPDHVVRTVTENCNTLKFDSFGFEED